MTDNTQELDVIFSKALTGTPAHEFKESILQWHNKQVEAVLDRFEQDCLLHYTTWGNSEKMLQVSGVLKHIEAERNKLKESK